MHYVSPTKALPFHNHDLTFLISQNEARSESRVLLKVDAWIAKERKITSSEEKKNIDQTNDSQLFSIQRFSVILQTIWNDLF